MKDYLEGIVLVALLRNSLRLKDFDYLVILGRQAGDRWMVCCWKRRSSSVPVHTTLPNTSPEGSAGSAARGLDDENESIGGVLTAVIQRTAEKTVGYQDNEWDNSTDVRIGEKEQTVM